MKTRTKIQPVSRVVVPVSFKAASAKADERTFEGLAAVWDLDLGGDIIHKGAFSDTLGEWKSSEDALPLVNSHDHFNIFSAIGQLIEAKETKEGLWTKWEVLDGPEGDAVMARLRPSKTTDRPIIRKMSIGFEPVVWEMEQPEGTTSFWDQIRHLKKVNLKEVSLVMFPMAPGAAIDASTVKQFLASADVTDPAELTLDMKVQLRKLSGKIGDLLSKAKGKKAEEPKIPIPPVPPTDLEDDDEEIEPGAEGKEEGDEENPGTDEGEGEGDEETDEGTVKLYDMQDALHQRLTRVVTKSKISEAKK